ncbi:MAG: DUF664 domain-containing protein [Anaerolineales bacterium]|jgi:uncharacterized damage-inducible protein DinB
MDDLMKSYVDMLGMLHEDCKETLKGLSTEQLDWRPLDSENSIAVLAVHIAGAEKFWVGDCILQESSNRDRPAEFATKGENERTLSRVLDNSLNYVRTAVENLPDDFLNESRVHPRTGDEITVAWALNHVIQHTALHLGHMQLTKGLLYGRSK